MELFTRVNIPASSIRIDYTSRIAFFGSCFAENIASKFTGLGFRTLVNPLGIIYNPLSIEQTVEAVAGEGYNRTASEDCGTNLNCTDRVFFDGEKWSSWDAHGSLSTTTRDECIARLERARNRAREFLKTADVVFITLGSAYVYFLKEDGRAVANCHRQNTDLFERRLITVDEATAAMENTLAKLKSINPKMHVVFTVSPLRHMGDGAHGNTLSKATLQLAVNNVINKVTTVPSASSGTLPVSYFPSYEIVMDELRDYRFYANDMIHLSATAEDYIFERMQQTYFDEATIANTKRVEKFMKAASHRIVNDGSAKAVEFANKYLAEAERLEAEIPELDLGREKESFKKILG